MSIACPRGCVFWWFERGGEFLRYEARCVAGPARYELGVTTPDWHRACRSTSGFGQFLAARQVEFEREFIAEGWTGPHGWNNKFKEFQSPSVPRFKSLVLNS